MTEQYAVVNGWLVANVGHHTCAGGTAESGYAHEPGCGQVAQRVIPANVVPRPPQPRHMGYPWPLDPIEVAELQQMREDYCEAAANCLSQQGSDFGDGEGAS